MTGYLPVRFFFSESIRAGYIPWWNPYVNFGIPQHADLSGGFWNPLTWLISLTSGYSVYTINLEALFYVFIGGAGMYKVGKMRNWHPNVSFIIAVSYMCCGYFIGNLQHLNWISGAGYLPWCYFFYTQLLEEYSFKKVLQNVFAFTLLITSSHPGILIGCIYFFLFITINHFVKELKDKKPFLQTLLQQKKLLLLLMMLLLSNAALIISYAEVLPYTTRDLKPLINATGTEATSIQSLISLLLPFATVKGGFFYHSDVALRNCYIGLIPLIFTTTAIYYNIKNRTVNFLLFTGLFFLLLSTGSAIQSGIYSLMPLVSYVRLPAEFRIFALFCFLLYGGITLNNFFTQYERKKIVQKTTQTLAICTGLLTLMSIVMIFVTGESVINQTKEIIGNGSLVQQLKSLIDALTLYDLIFIQGLPVTLLLVLISRSVRKENLKLLFLLAITDMLLATTLNLPFTGYGKLSQSGIQQMLDASPNGIPVPVLHPIANNNKGINGIDSILGKWSFYSKQPGSTEQALYPIVFKTEPSIFYQDSIRKIAANPFLFFSPASLTTARNTKDNEIKILHYSPSSLTFSLKVNSGGIIILRYKYFPHWEALVDGKISSLSIYNGCFISVPTSEGEHTVQLGYNPSFIKKLALLQLTLLSFGIVALAILTFKKED